MTNRVQIGRRGGDLGAWVSKPGIDVQSANEMQLAFSSSWPHARLIGKGTIPIGACGANGGENIYDIPYGATYNPVPFVWAIASSADWTLRTSTGANGQYQYLNNQWHTYVLDQPGVNPLNGTPYGGAGYVRRGGGAGGTPSNTLGVPLTWASIKFITQIYSDRVRFRVNNYSATTYVKYLIMDVN